MYRNKDGELEKDDFDPTTGAKIIQISTIIDPEDKNIVIVYGLGDDSLLYRWNNDVGWINGWSDEE